MAGMDWFRWHHGSVTDPKFQLIARKSQMRLSDVLAVWAYLLESASQADERGCFGGIDCEALDCLFGFEDGDTKRVLTAMQERGLVEDERVASWDKRQPKREREDDKSTERVKAFRERQRQEGDGNAMKRHETPREEKSREESSVANATAGDAGATKAELWAAGKSLLAEQGMPERQCGSFVGKLVKDFGDTVVVEAVRAAVVTRPADAAEYIKAACQHAKGKRKPTESFAQQNARLAQERVAAFAPGIASKPSNNVIEVFDVPALASR